MGARATKLAFGSARTSAQKRVLEKVARVREVRGDDELYREIATKWWKKLCWNQWKVEADKYSEACDYVRSTGVSRDIALLVYHQWEAGDWQNDLADIADYSDDELLTLLTTCFGLDSIEKIQSELDWCAMNRRFRVPVAPVVAEEFETETNDGTDNMPF